MTVYMDHAATTSTHPEVIRAMQPYFHDKFANPSGIYSIAKENHRVIEDSRQMIADTLHARKNEIYFTAGGSEGDNWALKEIADVYKKKGKHIITTKIEHHGILHTCEYLEQHGFDVTYLDVDTNGRVDLEQMERAIRKDTILISVMFANNEIGTMEPIELIGKIARNHHILFHTDAVQAYGQVPIDVEQLQIDLLTASGHKFRGPKGTGFLYAKEGIKMQSYIHGGAQEQGLRAGTENVPGIVGLATAAYIADATMERRLKYETEIRDYMIQQILETIPYCRLNGHRRNRLPNNINISFEFIDSGALLIMLDTLGICASGGSACTSASRKPSHVLQAIGLSDELSRGTIRLTIGEETTKKDADYVIACIKELVEGLREQSPSYDDYKSRS
ncbi:cysteine desulfurase family protein [Eubacterium sp. MSJ-33]|uniref:cysteine desulfurase family protein n=1 Tax=Eubacterium sp. MSJ-33 TaxID=2841528 RepID=UPI001C76790E|nr:IscS subfamily cysteine desulfurase [Eubacterium sp. MSJ-33]QWT53485.1 IscS subfamily cysteine desulfurase [Eubacterium sp. MSJ-33]